MKPLSILIIFLFISTTCFGTTCFDTNDPNTSYSTTQRFKNKYPNAIVKQVTLEEYNSIKQSLESSGATFDEYPNIVCIVENGEAANRHSQQDTYYPNRSDTGSRHRGLNWDIGLDTRFDSDDAAVVVFVVIAVYVVAALVLYSGKFVYDVATDNDDSYEYWFNASYYTSSIMSSTESGYASGISLAVGFDDDERRVGLAADIGHLNARFNLTNDAKITIDGLYFVIGPTIRWRIGDDVRPVYFHMDLLAGTTENKEVGVLSVAEAGFSFSVYEGLRLGVSIGSMYLNLKRSEGLMRKDNDFNLIRRLEIGYQF